LIARDEYDDLVRDYTRRITGPSEESRLVESSVWLLGLPCETAPLLEALRLEASRFGELPRQPGFSLISHLSEAQPRWVHELILSLRCQSYPLWQLILVDDGTARRSHLPSVRTWAAREPRIRLLSLDGRRGPAVAKQAALAEASGDFVAFLPDTALLHPCALGIVARHLNGDPESNLVYSNEGRIDAATGGISALVRKPEFDLFTLVRQNYVGNLTFIGRDLLDAVRRDGASFRPEHDGVEDHDLLIRIGLSGRARPMHIPLFLYYDRLPQDRAPWEGEAAAYAGEKTLSLLDDILPEVYPGARWVVIPPSPTRGNSHPGIHLRELPGRLRPSLLVMIPFKDHADLTLNCLDSLERQVHDLDVRVVLIDNRSRDPETSRILRRWIASPRRGRYEIVRHDGPFNYARMHNLVVASSGSDADLLLFLNNDAELVSVDCLQVMAMQLLADASCGFVGIRLMYPDGRQVQHGGIKILGESLYVCGFHRTDHARDPGEYVADERMAFGVTFACAMTRRATYERLGGMEEILFPNAYGDVALCARAVEAGLRNYYFGTLVGRHFESKSRGRTIEDAEFTALYERCGAALSRWRLRDLSYSVLPAPLLRIADQDVRPGEPAPQPLPLRYRVADGVNAALKIALGPAHRFVRSAIAHACRLVRRSRPSIPSAGRVSIEPSESP
jgi:O-antigen biosynthesis protein